MKTLSTTAPFDEAYGDRKPIVNIAVDRKGTAAIYLQSIIMSSLVCP